MSFEKHPANGRRAKPHGASHEAILRAVPLLYAGREITTSLLMQVCGVSRPVAHRYLRTMQRALPVRTFKRHIKRDILFDAGAHRGRGGSVELVLMLRGNVEDDK